MEVPPFATNAASRWSSFTRWERAEVGRGLRRLGWTYGEIMDVLAVGKGTLAGWCRDIRLTPEQIESIKARRPSGVRTGIPVDTQRKRHREIQAIREAARAEVSDLISDPLWVAGVVLYWAEGDKSSRRLTLVNTDPRALRLFISWVRGFHHIAAEFVLSLHLHHGNDESAARSWWADVLQLNESPFTKTFVKAPGTGHRKNHLVHGVCRVAVRRSSDAWHRTMGWIDGIAQEFDQTPLLFSAMGR